MNVHVHCSLTETIINQISGNVPSHTKESVTLQKVETGRWENHDFLKIHNK